MRMKAIRPPAFVADAIARVIAGAAWIGTVAELHAAIGAAALDVEREDRTWPRAPVDLATCLRSQSDALRTHGLRVTVMPAELLIERLRISSRAEPEPPDRKFRPSELAA